MEVRKTSVPRFSASTKFKDYVKAPKSLRRSGPVLARASAAAARSPLPPRPWPRAAKATTAAPAKAVAKKVTDKAATTAKRATRTAKAWPGSPRPGRAPPRRGGARPQVRVRASGTLDPCRRRSSSTGDYLSSVTSRSGAPESRLQGDGRGGPRRSRCRLRGIPEISGVFRSSPGCWSCTAWRAIDSTDEDGELLDPTDVAQAQIAAINTHAGSSRCRSSSAARSCTALARRSSRPRRVPDR